MLLILQEKLIAMIVPLVVVKQKKVQQPVLIVHQVHIKIAMHPSRAKIALKTITKIYWAIPRAMNAPVDMLTKLRVLRHAMLSLLDRTVGTVKYVNVKQVIIAPVKLQTKRLVVLGRMQPVQNQFRVLNAHQARMRLFLVPKLAKIVTVIPTNLNPMLRNAFECKKVSTNPVQQPKLFVQRVNRVLVVTQRAKIA